MPELSYREAVRDALSQAMRQDDGVFVMGEDIAEMGGSMGVTAGMLDEFGPERIRNTPISEMAIVGAGIGAAMQGMRPVVEVMYEDFLTVSMEQIVNQAAKHRYMSGGQLKVPLTIRTQGGAGWSPGAQHAQQVEAWFVHVPGLKVVFASTPADVRGLLWSAIYDDNPVIFFEHRTLYGLKEEVPDELEPIPIGQSRVHREGSDVTVVATGRLVHEALSAAEQAESDGVSVEVWDPRTLQPLDLDGLVASVKKTNRCVVAHEAVTRMGFGAEIAAVVQEGEEVPAISGAPEKAGGEEPEEAPPPAPQQEDGRPAQQVMTGGRVKASPLARRIARERGIDVAALSGTGPEGRVVAEDVERAAAAPAAAPAAPGAPPEGIELVPLTAIRKTIARRLTEAWTVPVFQISMSADMSRLLALRERLVANLREGQVKPTVTDLLTKVSALALLRHRE